MKLFYWIVPILLFVAISSACTSAGLLPTAGSTAKLPAAATPAPEIPLAANPTSHTTPGTVSAPSLTLKPTQPPTATAFVPTQKMLGGQVVQINAQDLMTVTTPEFILTGQAPPETVVSVNSDFILIDSSQTFSFKITLQVGPNLVEIVASNAQDQQVSFELVIVYEPPS